MKLLVFIRIWTSSQTWATVVDRGQFRWLLKKNDQNRFFDLLSKTNLKVIFSGGVVGCNQIFWDIHGWKVINFLWSQFLEAKMKKLCSETNAHSLIEVINYNEFNTSSLNNRLYWPKFKWWHFYFLSKVERYSP